MQVRRLFNPHPSVGHMNTKRGYLYNRIIACNLYLLNTKCFSSFIRLCYLHDTSTAVTKYAPIIKSI